jgi:hypothetical protein
MALRHSQLQSGRPILHDPTPDYTKVKPKTNTYNTPKIGGQNIQVSGALTYSLVYI